MQPSANIIAARRVAHVGAQGPCCDLKTRVHLADAIQAIRSRSPAPTSA
jgi:hypothetical protein